MAQSTHWPPKSHFFPLGDISAVCLVSELPPEQSADILLLGCGDTHNILYTVYADLGAPSRNLDITCCDLEPAILARNVILFTLIAEMPSGSDGDEYISKMWNIYHHFFIDKENLDFLLNHCRKLIDLSSDLASWNRSKYGTFLRFCTAHTLFALRKHWMLYIKNLSYAEKHSMMKKKPNKLNISKSTLRRSAGMLAANLGRMGEKQFCHYWQNGATFDSESEVMAAANKLNPTFLYSANGFGLHYIHRSTDPLLSFHPAKVLAPIKDSGIATVTVSTLVKSAMEEFASWCRAFKERLKPRNSLLMIRLFAGDALAFCQALQYFSISNDPNTGIYASAWSSTLINLDGADYISRSAPLTFNVIDTSNLTDHLGLMNILIACRPLMRREPSSVLHTNTLSRFNMVGRAVGTSAFLNRLCGSIDILSLILDIVPTSYVSDFKTHSNNHEMYMEIEGHLHGESVPADARFFVEQFYERIYWRISSISDPETAELLLDTPQLLKFDKRQLAAFLCGVYTNMFSEEMLVNMAFAKSKTLSEMKGYSKGWYYIRTSFVYFLRLVRDRIHINLESLMDCLFDFILVEATRNIYAALNLSTFICQCFLHLTCIGNVAPTLEISGSYHQNGLFKEWGDIPRIVCVTFQVPKDALSVLEEFINQNELETLPLVCVLTDGENNDYCTDFQSFFGNIHVDYSTPEPSITIDEDPKGFQGSSPMIFCFYILTPMLKVFSSIAIGPHINLASVPIKHVIGLEFVIFSADVSDRNHVHITRERPGNHGELRKLGVISSSAVPRLSDCIQISLDSKHDKVETMTGRAKKLCCRPTMLISPYRQVVAYPFPIDPTGFKTRISRRSSYIEVEVKILCPEEFRMRLEPYPLIMYRRLVSLWNIHYLHLDQLPILDLSRKREFGFLPAHTGLVNIRGSEICLRTTEPSSRRKSDAVGRMKLHIAKLFIRSCKALDKRSRVFALGGPVHDVHKVIFVNNLRLDLASHTIVADAMVLDLTLKLAKTLATPLKKLKKNTIFELNDWKHILPTFVERCRKWKHMADCEYLKEGVPRSQELTETLFCNCGKGKDLVQFEQEPDWKPFVPHSTRVAISQLFGVNFFPSTGEDFLEMLKALSLPSTLCNNCGSSGFLIGEDKLYHCGTCNIAGYCSRKCQKAHWAKHKKMCKKV